MPRFATRPRRGISLFEAIAALTIVGMTAVSALAAVGAGLRTAERARRALVAEALATQRVDMLDLLSEAEILSLPDSVAEGQFDWPLDEYWWTTASEPHVQQAGIFAVDIEISWPTGSYLVQTQVFRRPVITVR